MGFNPFKKKHWEKVGHKIEHGVKDAAGTVKHGVEDAVDTVKDGIGEAKIFTKSVPDRLKSEIIEGVEEVAREVQSSVTSALFKKALERAVKLARLGPESVYFQVQAVVGLNIVFSPQEVLEKVAEWVDKPPVDTDDIKKFIIAVAPSEVTLFAGIGISLGVEASVESGVTFTKDQLLEHWDETITVFI